MYEKNGYTALWSANGNWLPLGDSLNQFIKNSKEYGLFPVDYNFPFLASIQQQLINDTLAKKDAALWSRADVILTDALFQISQHLKRGRLPYDSLTSRKDPFVVDHNFNISVLDKVISSKQLTNTLHELEPTLRGYVELREGIKSYLDTAEFRKIHLFAISVY